jgi:hypothetical protein
MMLVMQFARIARNRSRQIRIRILIRTPDAPNER